LLALLISACFAAVTYICKTTTDLAGKYYEQREVAKIKYDAKTLNSQLAEFNGETLDVGFTWGEVQASHEITLFISVA